MSIISQLIKHPVKSFTTGVKTIVKAGTQTPKNVTGFVMPLSMGGSNAPSNAGRFAGTKNLLSKGFNVAKNELMGAPKNLGKTLKSALVGTGIATAGLTAGKYATTGKLEAPSARTFTELMGLRVAPFSTILGNVEGLGQQGISGGEKLLNLIKGKSQDISLPQSGFGPGMYDTSGIYDKFQNMSMPTFAMGDTILNFPEMQTPSMGGISGLASPSVDVNIPSMGGMDFSTILMLLGLAGGGGYLLGRKRKKKKYKKRRKHS